MTRMYNINVLIRRLCAAAFVQNRKTYTGCTDAPNPTGESGRAWCYVEAKVCTYIFHHQKRFHDLLHSYLQALGF